MFVLIWTLLWLSHGLLAEELSNTQRIALSVLAIAKFTHWPESKLADNQMTIGILGEDEMVSSLKELEGKTLQGRPVIIRVLSSAAEARSLQILWIADSKRDNVHRILHEMKGASVLTVSRLEGFIHEGGIIEFDAIGSEAKFSVNNFVAQAEKIEISAQVLEIARFVK